MSTSRAGAATAAFKTIELVPKEAELRVQLAAAYRLVEHFGWNESIYGHLTVRVPGPERHFLINPFGLRYGEVTASNLVKITLEGEIVGDTEWSVNAAGYAIHGAIHKGAPDAHCVMHTHSPAGMAVAALECGLLPDQPGCDALPRHRRLSRVRRRDRERRREGPAGRRPRPQPRAHPPQPRPPDRGPDDPRGLPLPPPAGDRVQDPGRRARHEQRAQPRAGGDLREIIARQIDAFSQHVNDIGALEFQAYMRMLDQSDAGYRSRGAKAGFLGNRIPLGEDACGQKFASPRPPPLYGHLRIDPPTCSWYPVPSPARKASPPT